MLAQSGPPLRFLLPAWQSCRSSCYYGCLVQTVNTAAKRARHSHSSTSGDDDTEPKESHDKSETGKRQPDGSQRGGTAKKVGKIHNLQSYAVEERQEYSTCANGRVKESGPHPDKQKLLLEIERAKRLGILSPGARLVEGDAQHVLGRPKGVKHALTPSEKGVRQKEVQDKRAKKEKKEKEKKPSAPVNSTAGTNGKDPWSLDAMRKARAGVLVNRSKASHHDGAQERDSKTDSPTTPKTGQNIGPTTRQQSLQQKNGRQNVEEKNSSQRTFQRILGDGPHRSKSAQPAPSRHSAEKQNASQKNQKDVNLVQLLFPEEYAKLEFQRATKKPVEDGGKNPSSKTPESEEEELPRLDLSSLISENANLFSAPENKHKPEPANEPTEVYKEEDLTILTINGLDSNLSASDFIRIFPRGQHIEEWRTPGEALRVIPLRSAMTLDPVGGYALVFRNAAFASAYSRHLEHLHALSQQHIPFYLPTNHTRRAPSSHLDLNSYFKGKNRAQALQDFTLLPATQPLSINLHRAPFKRGLLKALLKYKGYPQLTLGDEDRSFRAVRVWIDAHNPAQLSVSSWLINDGLRRGKMWTAKTRERGFEVLSEPGRDLEEELGVRKTRGINREDEREIRATRTWLLTFDDEAEARRFVRVWHRAPWPVEELRDVDDMREGAPMVNAELLW